MRTLSYRWIEPRTYVDQKARRFRPVCTDLTRVHSQFLQGLVRSEVCRAESSQVRLRFDQPGIKQNTSWPKALVNPGSTQGIDGVTSAQLELNYRQNAEVCLQLWHRLGGGRSGFWDWEEPDPLGLL